MARSTSQISVGSPVSNGNYIVPDEVAVAVMNHEEQRRRALAVLVDELSLVKDNQTKNIPAKDPLATAPRALCTQYLDQEPEENEEDDDVFWTAWLGRQRNKRISKHGEIDL